MVKLFSGSDDYPAPLSPNEYKAEEFKKELFALYDKHGLSISHEDGQGAFIITSKRMEKNKAWMKGATVDIVNKDLLDLLGEPDPPNPNFNPNPAELNHDHDFLYKDN